MPKLQLWALAAWPASWAIFCSPVLAQTEPEAPSNTATSREPAASTSSRSISMGVASMPVYAGASERRVLVGAIASYQWANGLSIGIAGLNWRLSNNPQWEYGLGLGQDAGRKEGDSAHLSGLGDVKNQVTLTAFANARIAQNLSLNSRLELGSGNTREGAVLKIGAAYTVPLGDSMGLSLSVAASFANAGYMGNYFGVTAAQSTSSGYAAYTASGGLRDVGVGAELNYKIAPKWVLTLGLSGTALVGAAKDSPVVRKPNYASGLLGLTYSF